MSSKYVTGYGDTVEITPPIKQMLRELGVLDENDEPTRRSDRAGCGPADDEAQRQARRLHTRFMDAMHS